LALELKRVETCGVVAWQGDLGSVDPDVDKLRRLTMLDAGVEISPAIAWPSKLPPLEEVFPDASAEEIATVRQRVGLFLSWALDQGELRIQAMRWSPKQRERLIDASKREREQDWSDFSESSVRRAINYGMFVNR
jgi:hypothetical protein